MSDLTKLLRSNPVAAAILDGVEGVEHSAVQTVVHVGVPVVGTLITASANAVLAKALGAGAAIAEPQVDQLIADFETWLLSKV